MVSRALAKTLIPDLYAHMQERIPELEKALAEISAKPGMGTTCRLRSRPVAVIWVPTRASADGRPAAATLTASRHRGKPCYSLSSAAHKSHTPDILSD